MSKEADRHVQSVAAALDVLAAFDGDVRLRLKDLHERTGLNRSRLLRFTGTLEACGFIEHDAASGTYALGPKLYALGWMLHERYSQVSNTVRPVLKRLVADTGDTAFFSSVQGNERLVVASEQSPEGLRFIAQEGQVRPLTAGASSKVLLAFAPPSVLDRVLAAGEASNIDVEGLRSELGEIAAAGFAVSRGEVTAHGFAVAVPVARVGGLGCDALTLAGPLAKLTEDRTERHIERLLAAAAGLSAALARTRIAAPAAAIAAE